MPKFKRLPKSAKPFKFQLLEDFTITPRFDREFWLDFGFLDFREYRYGYGDHHDGYRLANVQDGVLKFYTGGKNNGLTCHRDHSWALLAAHCHDISLFEGYLGECYALDQFGDTVELERASIDRVFLSVLLDHVDTLSGWKKRLYKSFAYAMYWAVRANSIIKGVVK
jgi:hypothetical protein